MLKNTHQIMKDAALDRPNKLSLFGACFLLFSRHSHFLPAPKKTRESLPLKKRRPLLGASLLAVLLVLQGPLKADDTALSPAPMIGLYDFQPYAANSPTTGIDGIFSDFLKILQSYSGIEITPQLLPLARALRDAQSGAVDFLISYEDPAMIPNVDFIGSFGCITELIVTSKASQIQKLEDLRGKAIAFPRDGYFQIHHAGPLEIQAVAFAQPDSLLALLKGGRIDGFAISDWVFAHHIGPLKDSHSIHPAIGEILPIAQVRLSLSISRHSHFQDLIPILTKAISAAHKDQAFKKAIEARGLISTQTCLGPEQLSPSSEEPSFGHMNSLIGP